MAVAFPSTLGISPQKLKKLEGSANPLRSWNSGAHGCQGSSCCAGPGVKAGVMKGRALWGGGVKVAVTLQWGESMHINLRNEAFLALCPSNSERTFPSQCFHLKQFFIGTVPTMTPPGTLKAVTSNQCPQFLWKAEGCKGTGGASALLRRGMR